MEKILKKHMCLMLAGVLLAGTIAVCSASEETVSVTLNGEVIAFEVAPQVINDRTMVPMRRIFELLGAELIWNQSTQTVTAVKGTDLIQMQIGSTAFSKNGQVGELDAAPVIADGSTLVPLRAVSEGLGVVIDWEETTRTASITEKEKDPESDAWKANTGSIDLNAMTVIGDGVSVSGNTVEITQGGDFTVTGTLADGMIHVDTEEKVKLRLAGTHIANSSGPAIFFENSKKGFITIEDGTENSLTDSAQYTVDAKAALFSNDDLEIKGGGTLTVTGNYRHAIASDDEIEIGNGTLILTAVKDGINANDGIYITDGAVTITAGNDGIQAGEVLNVAGGNFAIATTGDPEQTELTTAEDGTQIAENISSKGIKSGAGMVVSGGSIDIASTDHGVHSGATLNMTGGNLMIASSQGKGISAHGDLSIDGGKITVTQATEGIESKAVLTVNDGEIEIFCSDDGLNAGGTGSGGGPGGGWGGMGQMPQNGGGLPPEGMQPSEGTDGMPQPGRWPGEEDLISAGKQMGQGPQQGQKNGTQLLEGSIPEAGDFTQGGRKQEDGANSSEMRQRPENGTQGPGGTMPGQIEDGTHHIYINGGYLSINAQGDGIDSNGGITINSGTILVNGPTSGGDGALDAQNGIIINGGTLIAMGSAAMAEKPNTSSIQRSMSIIFETVLEVGTLLRIENQAGEAILTVAPEKNMQSLIFSSPLLAAGETYLVYTGGTASGESRDGVYENASYSGGALVYSVTVTGMVTSVGNSGRQSGGRGFMAQ